MSLDLDKSGYATHRFSDIVKNVADRVDDPSAAGVDKYVGLEHLDSGSLEIARWGEPTDVEAQKLRFAPGDVIFGRRRAYQKKVGYAEFAGICSAHALVLRGVPGKVAPEFLPFFIASDCFLDRAISISVGSLSPTVNWRDLAVQEFTLPPLSEQRRLADLFWAAEHHRRALAAATQSLSIARERDFDVTLEAGLKSDGWRSQAIAELVTDGPTNGKSVTANGEERGLPTLSISAIRDGKVLGGHSVKYVDIPRPEVEPFLLEQGDFLVVRGNGNKSLTGRGGLVAGGLPDDCFYPDLLIRLRFDEKLLRRDFAAQQWNSGRAHAALIRKAKSTNGIWKINGQDIKSHELVVPPQEAQAALLDTLGEYDAALAALSSEALALAALSSRISTEVFR